MRLEPEFDIFCVFFQVMSCWIVQLDISGTTARATEEHTLAKENTLKSNNKIRVKLFRTQ